VTCKFCVVLHWCRCYRPSRVWWDCSSWSPQRSGPLNPAWPESIYTNEMQQSIYQPQWQPCSAPVWVWLHSQEVQPAQALLGLNQLHQCNATHHITVTITQPCTAPVWVWLHGQEVQPLKALLGHNINTNAMQQSINSHSGSLAPHLSGSGCAARKCSPSRPCLA
jgi:hypothetical protein